MLIGDEITWVTATNVSARDFIQLSLSKPTLRLTDLLSGIASRELYEYLKMSGVTNIFIPTTRSGRRLKIVLILFFSEEKANTLL